MKTRFVDLSHRLQNGMPVYPGFPEPAFGSLLDHESSRSRYDGRAEFFLSQVQMSGNLGTYIDSPFHRFRNRPDLGEIPLSALVGLPRLCLDARIEGRQGIPELGRGQGLLKPDRWQPPVQGEPSRSGGRQQTS